MPLFMDMHTVEGGVSAAGVAGAHQADLATAAAVLSAELALHR